MDINIIDVLSNLKGSSFASLDTVTDVTVAKRLSTCVQRGDQGTSTVVNILKLAGITENPFVGKVRKVRSGVHVQLFTNTNSNAYENMVKRRLEKEGKNKEDFVLSKGVWGTRIKDSPIIEHNGEFYLEVILHHAPRETYYEVLDNNGSWIRQPKEDILGLPVEREVTGQGGLENSVVLHRYKLSSIREIRIDGTKYTGSFVYNTEAE